MSREEIARKIRWSLIIWILGFVNVVAMLPQLVNILATKKVEGVSVLMFIIYDIIQIAFTIEGYFKRSNVLAVCMALSAVVTTTIIGLVVYYR